MRALLKLQHLFFILCVSLCADVWASAPHSFADISQDATPAVVNVFTSQKVKAPKRLGFDINDFMANPFGFLERNADSLEGHTAPPQARNSLGSGFIIDPDGYIVTNYHVVEQADEINVRLSDDGEEYKAEVIGLDKKTDLALIKIKASKPLPYLEFGNSENIRVGDWILVIGNPFGLGGSVTAGIISAKSRHLNIAYDDFIQTDASINMGNSGGPMIDMKGKVIGVNNMILSPDGGNVGVGFAIPSSIVQAIVHKLKTDGKVIRSWLGVRIQKITSDIAHEIGLKNTDTGVLIASVLPDGPAAKAGFMPGDVVMKFDNTIINNHNIIRVIAETAVGKKVDVEILRNSKKLIIEMVTEASQEEKLLENAQHGYSSSSEYFGIKAVEIDDMLRAKYKIPDNLKGVIISEIKRGSVAHLAGLIPGVMIMKVNNEDTTNLKQFSTAMDKATKDARKVSLLYVYFNGESQFIVLKEE